MLGKRQKPLKKTIRNNEINFIQTLSIIPEFSCFEGTDKTYKYKLTERKYDGKS